MIKAKVGISFYQEVEVTVNDELKPLFDWVDDNPGESVPDEFDYLYTVFDSEWSRLEKELNQDFPYCSVVNMITSSNNLVAEL